MKLNSKMIRYISKNNENCLLVGLATFTAPVRFLRSIYSHNIGRTWNGKKSCFTFSFDCDYPADVEALPYTLKLLKKYSFKASFACVGHWIEKYPEEHKMVLEDGHEIVNHTYSHPDNEILNPGRRFKEISREEKMEEIARCHRTCQDVLGYAPTGCRIPHFKNLFTADIYEVLKELGYGYSSSTLLTNTQSFGAPFIAEEGIVEFPLSTCPKHPFTVFDTWHSFNSPRLAYKLIHRSEANYNELFKVLVNIGIETNSYINIYIDPANLLKMKEFDIVLAYIKNREKDIWVAGYDDILKKGAKCIS